MSWNSPASVASRTTRSGARVAVATRPASSATLRLCSHRASIENGRSAAGLYRENRSAASTSVRVISAPSTRTACDGHAAGRRRPTSAEFATCNSFAAIPASSPTISPTFASEKSGNASSVAIFEYTAESVGTLPSRPTTVVRLGLPRRSRRVCARRTVVGSSSGPNGLPITRLATATRRISWPWSAGPARAMRTVCGRRRRTSRRNSSHAIPPIRPSAISVSGGASSTRASASAASRAVSVSHSPTNGSKVRRTAVRSAGSSATTSTVRGVTPRPPPGAGRSRARSSGCRPPAPPPGRRRGRAPPACTAWRGTPTPGSPPAARRRARTRT